MAVNKPVATTQGAVRERSQLKTKVEGEAHWTKRSKALAVFDGNPWARQVFDTTPRSSHG